MSYSSEEQEPLHRRVYKNSQFLFDLVRAILYIGVSIVLYGRQPEGLGLTQPLINALSILVGIYGLFRLWRAWYYSPLNKKRRDL
ncbi:MAG: hypothetical protein RL660_3076 [Bacteroidota bacterium]|jgi:hypothetical protein